MSPSCGQHSDAIPKALPDPREAPIGMEVVEDGRCKELYALFSSNNCVAEETTPRKIDCLRE